MKILGLDIGIASLGFALLDFESQKILTLGSHLFEAAEQPKTGASLAEPRRSARLGRRVIRRKARRMVKIHELLAQNGIQLPPQSELFSLSSESKTPWELRADGLERQLEPVEWGRVLYHIAKHRGFKSIKKGEANDKEAGKLKKAANEIANSIEEVGCKTAGEFFYKIKLAQGKRVRNGDGDYSNSILRKLNEQEVDLLFETQRNLGSLYAKEAFQAAYKRIAFHQRPLKSVESMVGYCELEEGQRRAPKASRTAELFVLWTKINHLRIQNPEGDSFPLSNEQRQAIYEKAHQVKSVDYGQLRKLLGLEPYLTFKGLYYQKPKGKEEVSTEELLKLIEKKPFCSLSATHELLPILGDAPSFKDEGSLEGWDEIARILSFQSDLRRIDAELRTPGLELSNEQIAKLQTITSFKGTIHHSVKAIRKLLPYLVEGETYDKAVELAGYNRTEQNKKQSKLPAFIDEQGQPLARNPVVTRALAQTRKVINAVIREYGMPDKIHVELARELSKPKSERNEINKELEKRRVENEQYKLKVQEEFQGLVDPLKVKLWKQQDCYCLYSGKRISPELLKDPLALQIDHALPYSRSFDNSLNNKVLVFADENQRKKNRTVWEYFRDEKSPQAWLELEARIKLFPKPKKDRLLNKVFDQHETEWKSRNLNDTRYMAKLLKSHIEKHLALPGDEKKQKVLAVSGGVTAFLRRNWGLSKNREESARHHAQDAVVIAAARPWMIKQVAEFNKLEARRQGKKPYAPKPWDSFRDDVLEAVEGIFVSRMPVRKVSGEIAGPNPQRLAIHPETGREVVIDRVKLLDLNLKKLEKLVDKDTHNAKLYQLLKQRLEDHNDKADKAFHADLPLIMLDGGQRVHKVSLWGTPDSGRMIRGGLVSNGDQVRTDVFEKDGKFYLCPVYAWHFITGELPTGLIKQGVKEENWPQLTPAYNFKFSLYKNDFVHLIDKNGEVIEGYFIGIDRATAQVNLRSHDGSTLYKKKDKLVAEKNFGVLQLKAMKKYAVDFFGRKFEVTEKERASISKGKRNDLANGASAATRQVKPETATT